MKTANLILFFLLYLVGLTKAQDSIQNKRLKPLILGSSVIYTGSLIALNELWYADFERQSFHFFNDNNEWKQIDKVGHFYSAFHLSHLGYRGLKWAGVGEDKALFWGTMVSAFVLTPIEIFDGFSAEYGASSGDLVANCTGALLFFGQKRDWNDIRIHPKFSFQRSGYAHLRPEILGANLSEELLKDYNAQTYWLSFDLSKFNSYLPKWLNLALGYSADGMIYANDSQNKENSYNPVRKYYLALDLDFNEYKGKSKWINTLIDLINVIKLPAPTLELSSNKFRLHSFYY